jgi:hypothetical protein
MKKYTVAIPVAIALLTFGVYGKAMALDVDVEAAAALAAGNANAANDGDATQINKTDVDVKKTDIDVRKTDIDVKKDIDITRVSKDLDHQDVDIDGAYNAVAGIGDASVDKSVHIGAIKVAVQNSRLDGEVSGNRISFGNGLEMKAIGNEGGNVRNNSDTDMRNKQVNASLQANGALQGNGALQASGALQGNDADLDRIPVSALGGDEAEANGSDKAVGKNDSDAKNLAAGLNKAKGENDADQDGNARQSYKAAQIGVATTGDYEATQTQTVSLATGANTISAAVNASGITALVQNTGINSMFQQSVNVQATATINP